MISKETDVLVIGGGNAGLCAAIAAREAGARVLLVEHADRNMRGGNSRHTRNLRARHDGPLATLEGSYSEDEYWQDILRVTAGKTDEVLTRKVINESTDLVQWLQRHGVHFQPALSGTLNLSRTNAFFLGGGKALVNALYLTAERLGVEICYDTEALSLEIGDGWFTQAQLRRSKLIKEAAGQERADRAKGPTKAPEARKPEMLSGTMKAEGGSEAGIANSIDIAKGQSEVIEVCAKAVVIASGGFQANTEWLTEVWGEKARNFLIRGTPFARGRMLKELLRHNMKSVGSPDQCHAVAIDARAPRFDGGIVSRLDSVPFGIVVNRHAERFYDEGEDFWPKRYAIWGRLVAEQPDQIAYSIIDAKCIDRFMPSVFPALKADSIPELAGLLALDPQKLSDTINGFNESVQPGHFDQNVLDACHTANLEPPKSHWAQAIDTPPYYAYPLRPGITFTYLGVAVDDRARVLQSNGQPCGNVFAAGEIMAGNILGQGYCAGTGMSIGGVFGRTAGEQAACRS